MGPGCHFDVSDSIELSIVELTRVACSCFMLLTKLQFGAKCCAFDE